jgi:hypothetical protein
VIVNPESPNIATSIAKGLYESDGACRPVRNEI